ncbi:MAG: GDP-mannose 4,6-dehydratase [Gemmataceae bacterium]
MLVRNSRVVVTGGAGFIGSHLVDLLLGRSNEVTVIDDFSSGSPANLAHVENHKGLRVVEADIRREDLLSELMRGADFVFHLATRSVRLSLVQPTVVHEVNTTGTLNVLKAAAQARVRRLLYCSSSEVNGTADVVPMPEDYHFRPETIYGASKLAGEYYSLVFHRSGWLQTVIARPHNNYGPREHYIGFKGEVIPRFILWARAGKPLTIYGDGRQTRDFTYVTETVDYLVRLMECDSAVGQVFNVCRGEEVSIREIAERIVRLTGERSEIVHLPGRPNDVLRLFGDPTKMRGRLGSSPRISIDDGLQRTIEWFQGHVALTPEVMDSLPIATWARDTVESWMGDLSSQGHARRAG